MKALRRLFVVLAVLVIAKVVILRAATPGFVRSVSTMTTPTTPPNTYRT